MPDEVAQPAPVGAVKKVVYQQPLRKSCQFCRRRKIKCETDNGSSRCKHCALRNQDCIYVKKGTHDETTSPPPPPIPMRAYRSRQSYEGLGPLNAHTTRFASLGASHSRLRGSQYAVPLERQPVATGRLQRTKSHPMRSPAASNELYRVHPYSGQVPGSSTSERFPSSSGVMPSSFDIPSVSQHGNLVAEETANGFDNPDAQWNYLVDHNKQIESSAVYAYPSYEYYSLPSSLQSFSYERGAINDFQISSVAPLGSTSTYTSPHDGSYGSWPPPSTSTSTSDQSPGQSLAQTGGSASPTSSSQDIATNPPSEASFRGLPQSPQIVDLRGSIQHSARHPGIASCDVRSGGVHHQASPFTNPYPHHVHFTSPTPHKVFPLAPSAQYFVSAPYMDAEQNYQMGAVTRENVNAVSSSGHSSAYSSSI